MEVIDMKKKHAVIYGILVAFLMVLNVQLAYAHNWWDWHWHKNTLHIKVSGSHQYEALAAIRDWDRHVRDLKLHTVFKNHTDISVFGVNFGATGWGGLATIESYGFDWWHKWNYSKIKHAHATYNSYYGGTGGTGANSHIRGIFCQEIGHVFGLHHSNTGDCMGKSYYNNINITGPHNWSDIEAKY